MLFQSYSSGDGLPNRCVCSFAQDRFGSIWVGTDEGICMFDGDSFITPSFLLQEPFLSASGRMMCIDSRNILWLVTGNGLVNYNLNTGTSRLFEELRPTTIKCDGDGIIWMKLRNGLARYNPDEDVWAYPESFNFIPVNLCINTNGELCATSTDGCIYINEQGKSSFSRIDILSRTQLENGLSLVNITPCDSGRIIYTTSDNSAFCLNTRTRRSDKIFDGHTDGNDAILTGIIARSPDQVWLATDNGLFIIDMGNGGCTRYMNHPGNPYSLASSKLRCLFKDNQDRIWLGTFYDGLSKLIDYGQDTRIMRVRPDDPNHSLGGRTVRSICAGKEGIIWAATEDGTLEKIYPDGNIRTFGVDQMASTTKTYQSIACSEDEVYAVDLGGGLSVFDNESLVMLRRYDVGSNYCHTVLLTSQGEVLVGTSLGLYRLDKGTDRFELISSIHEEGVVALCEDRRGNIWVSVSRYGVYVLSPADFEAKSLEITDGTDISKLYCTDFFEDRDRRIWATTGGSGLYIFDPDRNEPWKARATNITRDDGLPSNLTCAVTQDRNGRMWISTKNGIVSLDNDTISDVTEFSTVGNCFCNGSILFAPDGKIYMGSSEGMVAFNPEGIPVRKHNLYLTDITKVKENSFTPVSETGHSPFTSRSIRIHSRETSSLIFRLACLRTDTRDVVRYKYTLTGKGREISSISNEKLISYANLTPGRYAFTANVIGDDSPEAGVALAIRVVPPVYASFPARIAYLLLCLGLIAFIIYFKLKMIRDDKERAIERLETCRQKEVFESKINFFTNISHEIRTPLTLIKVPLDKIMENKSYLPEAEYDMKCIQGSTDRLLNITDQILDFRKMESGSADLSFSLTNLSKMVETICTDMKALAQDYSVSLKNTVPDSAVMIMCAPGSVEKIITNLVMNGIKYCESTVEVILDEIKGDKVRMAVLSDGDRIAPEESEKIFEPFYQSAKTHSRLPMNEGTGLGLPLARELAKLHKGTLTLDPAYEGGNSFILELPAGQSSSICDKSEEIVVQNEEMEPYKYSILVVEDDSTLNDYIKNELSGEYAIYQAYDGKEALKLLDEKSISLIVSDIMMPEMNGCELVDVVKSTLKYNHIPVILLTAVTDYATQLKSLHSGADGYITKPFSMQILRATIFNILKNREILFESFSTMPFSKPGNITGGQDDEFMKELYDYVLENISNQELSVLDLADRMNASRSTLFRKIRANTGMNINEYIRVCRLKKAAELLSTQKYSTKEVAYMVGFTSLSYFTKSFQKQFNLSPSSLLKKN